MSVQCLLEQHAARGAEGTSGEPRRSLPAGVALWRHLFGETRGFLCLLLGQRAGSRLVAVHERYFRWPDEAWDAWHHAQAADQGEREVYFCAHLLAARGRRKESALTISALWCEVDHPLGAEWPDALPLPTAQVQSSPGRWHPYWRLTHPVPPQQAEALNRALARSLGADPSGCDLTQVLRVPGTRNHKYPERPVVRLVTLDPEAAIDPGALTLSLGACAASADGRLKAAPPLPERIVEGARNVWLTSLAGSLRRRGLDHDEILAVLRLVNQWRCEPPLDDEELVKIARSIARYPTVPTGVSRITVEVL